MASAVPNKFSMGKPLPPLQSTIEKGPYAVDACRLIPQELLLSKPTDPFSVAELQATMRKWRRQARMLKFCPPAEHDADPSSWDKSNLQQLRLYIATTSPENRCLCTKGPLQSIDDHWPECPFAEEHRIKRFNEQQKKARVMKVRMVPKNLCEMLHADVMETRRDEEVRYLRAIFERESKKRSL